MLAGQVVVLGVGVNPPCALLGEEIVEERVGRLEGVSLALVVLIQHPAGAEGVPHGVFPGVGLACLRVGVDLADDLAAVLQRNGEIVFRLDQPLLQ